jgi:hypothetical protein
MRAVAAASAQGAAKETLKAVLLALWHWLHLVIAPGALAPLPPIALPEDMSAAAPLGAGGQTPRFPAASRLISLPCLRHRTVLIVGRKHVLVTPKEGEEQALGVNAAAEASTTNVLHDAQWRELQIKAWRAGVVVWAYKDALLPRNSSLPAADLSQMHARLSQVLGAPAVVVEEEVLVAEAEEEEETEARTAIDDNRDVGVAGGGFIGEWGNGGVGEVLPPGRVLSGNFGGLPATDRQIVVDGCNVAWNYNDCKGFSTRGLQVCLEWYYFSNLNPTTLLTETLLLY